MSENRRNILVGFFVLIGLSALGWMIFKFGDLPTWVSHYDAREITIYFPHAPGVQQNTEVLFCGYKVGNVISASPPALLPDLDAPSHEYYQVEVLVALNPEYQIPHNTVPKVYPRGLGGSFIEFTLHEPPAQRLLQNGDKLKGFLSEASGFISESTQRKFDSLLASLIDLSSTFQSQLTPLPPDTVDTADPNQLQPNITTAFMRMDTTLKNLNVFIGDIENQRNFRKGLADFATLTDEMRKTLQTIENLADNAQNLIDQASQTVTRIGDAASHAHETFQQTGAKVQIAADHLAAALNQLEEIFAAVSAGKGTAGRFINDPRLYESLNDTAKNLGLAVDELRQLLADINKEGAIKIKIK